MEIESSEIDQSIYSQLILKHAETVGYSYTKKLDPCFSPYTKLTEVDARP
jgi:hypothetical protein